MAKPPKTTPHSDIDGVHQEEVKNTEVAADLGQSGAALAKARKQSVARPEHLDKEESRERSD